MLQIPQGIQQPCINRIIRGLYYINQKHNFSRPLLNLVTWFPRNCKCFKDCLQIESINSLVVKSRSGPETGQNISFDWILSQKLLWSRAKSGLQSTLPRRLKILWKFEVIMLKNHAFWQTKMNQPQLFCIMIFSVVHETFMDHDNRLNRRHGRAFWNDTHIISGAWNFRDKYLEVTSCN